MRAVLQRITCCLFLFATTLGIASAEYTLDPALEVEAQWVYGQVLSPFCPGKLLRDCPSRAASTLKDDIRKKIDDGKSREEVIQELYLIYGDEISAVPRTSGFGLVAWITPALFAVIGFLSLTFWLKSRQGNAAEELAEVPPLTEHMEKTIDKLLNE